MDAMQVADDLKRVIDRQVAEGRAASEAEFLSEAVLRCAETLEEHENAIVAAADEGIADIEAGRFELISGPGDMRRLRAELWANRNESGSEAGLPAAE